jgi:hypothetical protein
MALDFNTVSFVGGAIKLAWEIYDKGFKEEKSSSASFLCRLDPAVKTHANRM